MLPKNSKHFIKPTADKIGCTPELVDDAVSFFYQTVRKNLIDVKGPNIMVEGIGSFKTKPKELPKLIVKLQKHLDVLKPETFNQVTLQKSLQVRLEKIKNLQKLMAIERIRKAEVIKKQYERKVKSNME